ncbi:hypothetical protein [Mesorhizobium sp. CAU 1732]|uniref:hypothetical protein n=1 Tax=Mesorhizobium sp. CAU 1732 TaxID=3140358 RepID=UPI0032606438
MGNADGFRGPALLDERNLHLLFATAAAVASTSHVKGLPVTDFPRLKTKYPDLIPERQHFQCGPGWEQVLDKYFDEVGRALPLGASLGLGRIYQKYGSLRIDAMPEGVVTDDVQIALDKAENLADSRSYRYCETCGKPGNLRDKHRWLYVACEAHADGAPPLPPDEGVLQLNGVAYEYDENLDDLVVVEDEHEAAG